MEPPSQRFTAETPGERLDRFLARVLDLPRNRVKGWILEGRVNAEGKIVTKASHALAQGNLVEVAPPGPAKDSRVIPEEGPLEVLYEDEDLIVLDKPPGLVVHPGAGNLTGTLVHRVVAHYPEMASVGGPGRPGIVHRLDQGTSGVMVLARTTTAYRSLSEAFAQRRVVKTYLAIAYGRFRQSSGRIDTPVGRHPQRRKEMAVRPSGKRALTHFKVLECLEGLSVVEVDLGTGRTHQIRVHLKSLGHPLVGDPTYGEKRWKGQPRLQQRALRAFLRPALHAWKLGFSHPRDGREMLFEATVPEDLKALWSETTGRPWP